MQNLREATDLKQRTLTLYKNEISKIKKDNKTILKKKSKRNWSAYFI